MDVKMSLICLKKRKIDDYSIHIINNLRNKIIQMIIIKRMKKLNQNGLWVVNLNFSLY